MSSVSSTKLGLISSKDSTGFPRSGKLVLKERELSVDVVNQPARISPTFSLASTQSCDSNSPRSDGSISKIPEEPLTEAEQYIKELVNLTARLNPYFSNLPSLVGALDLEDPKEIKDYFLSKMSGLIKSLDKESILAFKEALDRGEFREMRVEFNKSVLQNFYFIQNNLVRLINILLNSYSRIGFEDQTISNLLQLKQSIVEADNPSEFIKSFSTSLTLFFKELSSENIERLMSDLVSNSVPADLKTDLFISLQSAYGYAKERDSIRNELKEILPLFEAFEGYENVKEKIEEIDHPNLDLSKFKQIVFGHLFNLIVNSKNRDLSVINRKLMDCPFKHFRDGLITMIFINDEIRAFKEKIPFVRFSKVPEELQVDLWRIVGTRSLVPIASIPSNQTFKAFKSQLKTSIQSEIDEFKTRTSDRLLRISPQAAAQVKELQYS